MGGIVNVNTGCSRWTMVDGRCISRRLADPGHLGGGTEIGDGDAVAVARLIHPMLSGRRASLKRQNIRCKQNI